MQMEEWGKTRQFVISETGVRFIPLGQLLYRSVVKSFGVSQ